MAVRHREHLVLGLRKFKEGLTWAEELSQLRISKGLPGLRCWSPAFGKNNELVIEGEYPDLATFEIAQKEFYANAELMAVYRRGTELLAANFWPWDELEVESPHLA